jgi:hypothetical protein
MNPGDHALSIPPANNRSVPIPQNPTSTTPQVQPPRDPDHDGDNDAAKAGRAATPPGVGTVVDKDV